MYARVSCAVVTFFFFFFKCCPFSAPCGMKECQYCSPHNKQKKRLLLQLFGSFCMTLNLWMTLILYSKNFAKCWHIWASILSHNWIFWQAVRLMYNFTIFVTQKSKPSQLSPCYPSKNILWLFILSQIPHVRLFSKDNIGY